jgi:phosphatidylglycerol:prolipoprotein diacylglycerol transferase
MKNKRKYKGQILLFYLALYGFARSFIEILRADSLYLGNLKISQILSIILCVVSSFIIILCNHLKVQKT